LFEGVSGEEERGGQISTPNDFAHHGRHGDQDGRAEQAILIFAFGEGESLKRYIVGPVIASKSQVCREGHTSGSCRWLFSAADFE